MEEKGKKCLMLKVVVFSLDADGKSFVEKLEAELPVVEVIHIVGHLEKPTAREARKLAEQMLYPYIGKVDLVVIANYLLANTSLDYFDKKYTRQKFVGFTIKPRRIASKTPTLIVTTKAVTRSLAFFTYSRKVRAKTMCVDDWPVRETGGAELIQLLSQEARTLGRFSPTQILLACGHFTQFKTDFRKVFGHNVRVVDCFDDTMRDVCRALELRGGVGKKS